MSHEQRDGGEGRKKRKDGLKGLQQTRPTRGAHAPKVLTYAQTVGKRCNLTRLLESASLVVSVLGPIPDATLGDGRASHWRCRID